LGRPRLRNIARLILYNFLACIIGATIVDVDHPLHYLFGLGDKGRFLHPFFAFVALAVIMLILLWSFISYYRRLSKPWILKETNKS